MHLELFETLDPNVDPDPRSILDFQKRCKTKECLYVDPKGKLWYYIRLQNCILKVLFFFRSPG